MAKKALVLAYSGCQTCRKALSWLAAHGVNVEARPIVESPPTAAELAEWIPRSKRPVRKWLNTSGQSYRAIGKEAVDRARDDEIASWLTKDGKLVRRPVVVAGSVVLVGFDEPTYEAAFLR
jgi:arsenate reductase (glutaredoxin)